MNVAQTPTEGKLFEVNPLGIDRSKFEKPMSDWKQEWVRKIILDAFTEVDKDTRYASAFYTLIPEKKWNGFKNVDELKEYAIDLGGLMAFWFQQVLEWAQRISNGESWEDVCNNADTANWYRVVLWRDTSYRLVGGSRKNFDRRPVTSVDIQGYKYDSEINIGAVPLVVIKKT